MSIAPAAPYSSSDVAKKNGISTAAVSGSTGTMVMPADADAGPDAGAAPDAQDAPDAEPAPADGGR